MLVTRARANSSKNHTLLMCRIWKMGRNLFSSLDIRDNFKVAFLEKNSNNPKIYLVTITVWGTGSVINWVNLSCWLPDLKVDIWQNLPKKCHFQIISHVQWWTKFFYPFLHSTHQECMIFARIGTGSCYYHWHEICAGVIGHIWSNNRLLNEVGELCIANQAVIHGKEFIQNNACLLPFCTNHKLHLFLRRGPV